ncbi:Uu.00g118290.m01.CDS01 [Anthostomella pinea]|uniref:Uu.00g118290.m01.CDS01 n=1 Tax=Anthostomella pinea TaxID=933095 RepID=A0AAI8VHC2_9PEZI|nr:Uu.00g118290.m01.CDS01 [Anthostomella pinea]
MAAVQYDHAYPLDNQEEVSRLGNQHDVIKDTTGGRLILAPIDFTASPLKILDSGTADGTWIRDVAGLYPSIEHEFYGTDIKPAEFPVDPPKGTNYQVHDINNPWPGDWEGRFDFVHQRLVLVAAGANQENALKSLGRLVRPGGWIQVMEATNELPESCGPEMRKFVGVMNSVFQVMGADLKATERISEWLGEAGFVDIEHCTLPMKLGAQNPDATLAQRGVFSTSTAAKGLAKFAKSLPPGTTDLSSEELDTLGTGLEKELMKVGGVYPLQAVWGRKPV